MGRTCCARSLYLRTWGWPERTVSDAFDVDLVDHVVDTRNVAGDPEDLLEHLDRLDSAAENDGRPTDRDDQVVAGHHVRGAQRLDHVPAQSVVARHRVNGLDRVIGLELVGGIEAFSLDRLERRSPWHALLGGDYWIIGHARRRVLDQVALVLRGEGKPEVTLVHAGRGGKLRAGSISA